MIHPLSHHRQQNIAEKFLEKRVIFLGSSAQPDYAVTAADIAEMVDSNEYGAVSPEQTAKYINLLVEERINRPQVHHYGAVKQKILELFKSSAGKDKTFSSHEFSDFYEKLKQYFEKDFDQDVCQKDKELQEKEAFENILCDVKKSVTEKEAGSDSPFKVHFNTEIAFDERWTPIDIIIPHSDLLQLSICQQEKLEKSLNDWWNHLQYQKEKGEK